MAIISKIPLLDNADIMDKINNSIKIPALKAIFQELPVEKIEKDPSQPRTNLGTAGDQNRLLNSIKIYGIEDPIKVSEIEENRYIIMDGHRRYVCAQKLGLKHVPCRIYPKMSIIEFESRRYEIQNNRRPWRPLERAEALTRIKDSKNFRNNKELANYLRISETVVANSLQLRKQKVDHLGMMERYNFSDSYQTEFVRLKSKFRKIRNFEVDDIIQILFEKVKNKIIKNSKDFRNLGRIFLRATANESALYEFLSNPDMGVNDLENHVTRSSTSLLFEQLLNKFSDKNGINLSSQENSLLTQLFNAIQNYLFPKLSGGSEINQKLFNQNKRSS